MNNSLTLRCGRYELSLERPLVMGIVNITPDSFSDGGRFLAPAAAIAQARRLAADGADIIDLGAESTRPGAAGIAEAEELERVLPVLDALQDLALPISVDTMKPAVMRAAIERGAAMINDVNALLAPGAIEAVRESDCALCVMHMQGAPRTMQVDPRYEDVVAEVRQFLADRVAALRAGGVAQNRIVIDPGFGFGKTDTHNLSLLRELPKLTDLGVPVLAGWSRKSSLGRITGRPSEERLAGSVAAALIAVQRGARIVRVHDVAQTRDALAVWQALGVT